MERTAPGRPFRAVWSGDTCTFNPTLTHCHRSGPSIQHRLGLLLSITLVYPLPQPPIRHIAPRAAHLGPSGAAAHITLRRGEGKMKKEGGKKKHGPHPPGPLPRPRLLFYVFVCLVVLVLPGRLLVSPLPQDRPAADRPKRSRHASCSMVGATVPALASFSS